MKLHTLSLSSVALFLAICLAPPAAAAPPGDASPLAAYPGFGHAADSDDERFAREEMAREQMISRCMEQNGFRYSPTVSLYLEDFETPSQAMNAVRDDPNGRYERSLAADEGVRYRLALYGVEDPTSENADLQPDPAESGAGGCFGEAMRALPGVFAAKAELQEEYDALRRSVMRDLRVVAAERRWASCMARAGHTEDGSPRDLEQRHDGELSNLVGITRAELPSREALTALGEKHRAERQLTMRCARKVGLAEVVAAVRIDYETRFVAEHEETLDRHLERLRAQQSLLEDIEATIQ